MKAYLLTGLGADAHAFDFLKWPDHIELQYLDWETPEPDASMEDYARLLSKKIVCSEEFILVGLSLGGMLAVELSKIVQPKAVILISSIASASELPRVYHWAGYLKLHKVVPPNLFITASRWKRYFVTESPETKKIVTEMLQKSEPNFIQWGLQAILNWQNDKVPDHLYRIHGTKDEILPLPYNPQFKWVEGGRHLMILDHAKEVSQYLKEIITELGNCN